MSFSSQVKTELNGVEEQPCCEVASSYALLLFGRAFSQTDISILTEHRHTAEKYCRAVQLFSGSLPDIVTTPAGNCVVRTENQQIRNAVFDRLGYSPRSAKRRINHANLENECCFASFLRGAFLASGTITSPEKDYHLEFTIGSDMLTADFLKLFDEFSITPPKHAKRSGTNVLYYKNSEEIEDILSLMGATDSAMEIMGTKVYKNIRNQVNRKVNFETANAVRAAKAATDQYRTVCRIVETTGIDALPDDLREIARVRLENPEMTTSELSKAISESLSRSGISHRLKRLEDIAWGK